MEGPIPAVDFAAVMDRIGDDRELLTELVGLYLDDEGRLLAEIDRALAQRDAESLRRAAHTLKGAVSNFAAPAATAAALAVETAGREGRLEGTAALVDALRTELARVREVLSQLRP